MTLPSPLRLAAAASLSLLASCVSFVTPPHTAISSTPPGARVILDGKPSGYLTPCKVKLSDSSHRLRFELAGHTAREFVLTEGRDLYLIPWSTGYSAMYGWRLPFYLDGYDLFFPIRVDGGHSPDRVHVTLDPVGTAR